MSERSRAAPGFDAAYLWTDYPPTTLMELPELARLANIARAFVKVEAERPLGSFKVLGGTIAGLRALGRAVGAVTLRDLTSNRIPDKALPRLLCASAGNHGLAIAAVAGRVGTRASIYVPSHLSRGRTERIEAAGGELVQVSGTFDDAVREAGRAAARGEGILVPDTTTDPDDVVVGDVMAGYGLLGQELVSQFRDDIRDHPSHLFVQAGVGGLAAALAEGLRPFMRAPGRVLVVEPASAACVALAMAAGRPVHVEGSLHSCAEMLACGLASAPALRVLQRHDARSILVCENQLQTAVSVLRDSGGPDTTPSGAAGIAGMLHVAASARLRSEHRLTRESNVLVVATEGPIAGNWPGEASFGETVFYDGN